MRSLVLRSNVCRALPVNGSSRTALSGKIVCDQKLVAMTAVGDNGETRGIRNCRLSRNGQTDCEVLSGRESGCRETGMNLSGATLPAAKL